MKNISRLIAIIAAQVLCSCSLFADVNNFSPSLNSADSATARAENSKYYWIGTNSGLYLVNKKNKRVFHITAANSSLPSDSVTAIAVRPDGEVYIGTTQGMLRYDNYTFLTVTTENSSLRSNRITALVGTNNGDIYAGTDAGITIFSGSASRSYISSNANSNSILSLKVIGPDSLVADLGHGVQVGIRNRKFMVLVAGD